LLDEDIGGFVGIFLFDSVDDIKDNSDVMKDIFGNVENFRGVDWDRCIRVKPRVETESITWSGPL